MLPLARYRFHWRVSAPIHLPAYAGSMLRGAFGHALRRLACMTRQADCAACPLLHTCPYPGIFAPPPVEHSLQRFSQMPAPYVIEPPAWGERTLEVGEALYRLQAPPTKLLVIRDPREIPPLEASLREAFGSRVHVAGSQKGFLEVVPRGIHKGLALLWLADALGIPRGQVLALGDGDNDAEMLASVPLGVAVPQGSLRARAGAAFTAPEGEDPVVWAVRRFALEGRGFPSP